MKRAGRPSHMRDVIFVVSSKYIDTGDGVACGDNKAKISHKRFSKQSVDSLINHLLCTHRTLYVHFHIISQI